MNYEDPWNIAKSIDVVIHGGWPTWPGLLWPILLWPTFLVLSVLSLLLLLLLLLLVLLFPSLVCSSVPPEP